MALGPAARAAMEALCRRFVPQAYHGPADAGEPPARDLADEVEKRIALLGPLARAGIERAFALFESRTVGFLMTAWPRRFSRLDARRQTALLYAWEDSAVPQRRAAFQAVRRLILGTWYTLPAGLRDAGHLGPLHLRSPEVAWEGPLQGVPHADDPVARTTAANPARPHVGPPDPPPAGVTIGDELPVRTHIGADVCVIGSGAGGAVVAARLAEAGYDVVTLEEGGWWRGADFDENEATMTARLYADGGMRATDDGSIALLQGRAAGGGTTVNWMIVLRPADHVMDEWERAHGAELLSRRRLVPELDRIEDEIGARLVPDDAHSPANRLLLDAAERLDWRAHAAKINARGCVRAGTCGLGCRWGARQGAIETFIPRALEAGARLLCDTRVDRIEVAGSASRATPKRVHARIMDRATGAPRGQLEVQARIVVLAAGAVGTPALLQRSGLGGGGVGRFLRLHPTTAVMGSYDRTIYAAAGIPQSAVCDEFADLNDGYGFWIECPPLSPGLAAAALQGFGEHHADLMRQFPNVAPFIVLVRDGAERNRSRGSVRVDRRGRTTISYSLGSPERAMMREGLRSATRMHLEAGAREVRTLHVGVPPITSMHAAAHIELASLGPNRISLFSAHLNGTCRMGTNARTSGCTPNGERHGAPGIFIADGSALPTAPGVNPQATIMALASLVAERVREICV